MNAPKNIKIVSWAAIIFSLWLLASEIVLYTVEKHNLISVLGYFAISLLLAASAFWVGRLDKNSYYIFNIAILVAFGWITGAIIAVLIWFLIVKKNYYLFK